MITPYKVHMPDSVKKPLIETLFSGFIGQGKKVKEFESSFSSTLGIPNVVSLNSGTSALKLALSLADIGPDDEVISTPYTMVATNTAIMEQFARPVFADVQYSTINIDPKDIEHRITDKTKAIMCVHWGGYPCDMDEILRIAHSYDLIVVEDAAHALGAKYKGTTIGNISDYTAFSFQAIKHITTGDGGLLSVKNKSKFEEARRRSWFGIDRKNRRETLTKDPLLDITELGFKIHMNDINATIGIEQLKYFNELFEKRAHIARSYSQGLKNISGVALLERRKDRVEANWMYAFHTERRNEFVEFMISKGIGVTIHNWRNDRYSIFGGLRKDLPNLDKVNQTLVNLPIHHDISDDDVNFILDSIKSFYGA